MEKRDNWSKIEIAGKIIGAILVPVIILLLGNVYNKQQKIADQYQRDFQNAVELIKLCNHDNKGLKLAGFDYAIYLERQGYLDTTLISILSETQANESDAELAKLTAIKLEQLKEASPDVYQIVENLDNNLSARVYFHIKYEEQRIKAKQLEIGIEGQGDQFKNNIKIPGIELRNYSLSLSEIRFFRKEEETEAKKIKQFFDSVEVPMVLRDLSKSYKNSKIRPRHYEIWFGENFN